MITGVIIAIVFISFMLFGLFPMQLVMLALQKKSKEKWLPLKMTQMLFTMKMVFGQTIKVVNLFLLT